MLNTSYKVYMKSESFFKFLFWFLTTIFVGAMVFAAVRIGLLAAEDQDFPLFMAFFFSLLFLLILGIFAAIAVFVYRDAPKRGMNRWMWVTIATYAPNLIGLIVYVIVRNNYGTRCLNCGKHIKSDFEVCPYCGNKLDLSCKNCGRQVSAEWKVCPYCKKDLVNG